MTNNNHPITPPPELVAQIRREALHGSEGQLDYELRLIHDAYRAGADMELGACGECVDDLFPIYSKNDGPASCRLRAARRPKPKSVKERGREALQSIHAAVVMETGGRELDVLKEIVESLPD